MALTLEQKKKAKKALFRLATPDERAELSAMELIETQEKIGEVMQALHAGNSHKEMLAMLGSLSDSIRKMNAVHASNLRQFSESFKEMQDQSLRSIKDMHGSLVKNFESQAQGFDKNAGPLYKTMINHLAGMRDSFSNWKYPQYASVSVRDKNFANLNPATADNQVFNTVVSGRKQNTTAGTAVKLVAVSTPCSKVVLSNPSSNVGTYTYVGNSTASAVSGSEKGEILVKASSIEIFISDASFIYFDVDTSNDYVVYNIYSTV